jgi:hypothetical protein
MDIKDIKANNIEEFFGTLQQSVVESWRKHLKTDKYSEHIALNEFYEEMPDLVDDLIEAWMGINGKVKTYKNNFTEEKMGTIEYLETLKEFVKTGKEDFMEEDELESLCDDILSQIDSTLYKIKELKENKFMDLKDFLTENNDNINEAKNQVFMIVDTKLKETYIIASKDEPSAIKILTDNTFSNEKNIKIKELEGLSASKEGMYGASHWLTKKW